jgi:TPR repeat protein
MVERFDKVSILQRAEAGDPESQYILGQAYYTGDICDFEPDFATAAYWLVQAAEQGNVKAMFSLGTMYYLGFIKERKGAHINYKKSADWFCEAAKIMIRAEITKDKAT